MTTAVGESILADLRERIDPTARAHFDVVAPASVPLLIPRMPGRLVAAFTTRFSATGEKGFDLSRPLDGQGGESTQARAAAVGALAASVGLPEPTLVSPRQVHGTRVVGAAEYLAAADPGPCDGLTVQPGLDDDLAALLVFADCVPVIMVGEVDAVLLHGGWRGLLGGIVQQGAAAMTAPPGSAVIGPSIGPCCYTVDDGLARTFAQRYGEGVVREGARLDLWEVATRAAGEVGVPRTRVVNPRLCTVCNRDLFFSYRADGPDTGRHGAFLWCRSRPETGLGWREGVGSDR